MPPWYLEYLVGVSGQQVKEFERKLEAHVLGTPIYNRLRCKCEVQEAKLGKYEEALDRFRKPETVSRKPWNNLKSTFKGEEGR